MSYDIFYLQTVIIGGPIYPKQNKIYKNIDIQTDRMMEDRIKK